MPELISGLHREISVNLNDQRADLTTVIECLKLIRDKSAAAVSDSPERDCDSDESTPACPASPRFEPATDHSTTAARLVARHQIEQLSIALQCLQERLEKFATTLAMSIVAAGTSQSGDSNPWDEMPDKIRASFPSIVSQLHGASVQRFLVRSIGEGGIGTDAESIVSQMIETTVPMLTSVLDRNRELLIDADPQPDASESRLTSTAASTQESFSDSHSQTAVTCELKSILSNDESAEEPLSIEEALIAVKPSMLAFGGLQRLMLVVGSQQERSQLEPQVRQAHQGSLTVAVVPGSTPKLIHEAQQVDLTNVLSRLTILNGGNTQVTGRLSSRTDITW